MEILAKVGNDEIVTVTKTKKQVSEDIPAYDCIGGNMEYQTKIPGYPNLYSVLQDMSKQTAWLWWELVKLRNRYTNEATYQAVTGVDKRRLTVAYKELHALDLVKRIQKQRYIINPRAYLPERGHFMEVLEKWKAL